MIYFQLAFEFLKIGIFSFGGGYATIPFLYHISEVFKWYSLEDLIRMIAVSSITPGPIGINMATYAGLNSSGIFGALVATISVMFPSLILVLITAKLLKKYSDNFYVKAIIETLKPIGCALLASVAISLLKPEIKDLKAMFLLGLLLLISFKSKKEPLFYILISGFIGVLIYIIF